MAFCFKIYGASYLHNLLQPLLKPLLENPSMSFEVDPARLDAKDDINENRSNLVTLTERVFCAIVSSADKFPTQLRSMCHCLYQVLSKRYPQFPQNNIGAVGTVIFLRFINPAIGRLNDLYLSSSYRSEQFVSDPHSVSLRNGHP